jgi:hypothetical protein
MHVPVAAQTKMPFVKWLHSLSQQVVVTLVRIRPVISFTSGAALQPRSHCRVGAIELDEMARRMLAPGEVPEALPVLGTEVSGVEDDNAPGSEAAPGESKASIMHELVLSVAVSRPGDEHTSDPIRTDHRDGGPGGERPGEMALACAREPAQ